MAKKKKNCSTDDTSWFGHNIFTHDEYHVYGKDLSRFFIFFYFISPPFFFSFSTFIP